MPLSISQLATDMDLVSASLEAHDVNPSNVHTNATLKTAALRLKAAFAPWLRKASFGVVHQNDIFEAQISANDYEAAITYTV